MYVHSSLETRAAPRSSLRTQPLQAGTSGPERTSDSEDPDPPEHLGTYSSPANFNGVLKQSGCPNFMALEPRGPVIHQIILKKMLQPISVQSFSAFGLVLSTSPLALTLRWRWGRGGMFARAAPAVSLSRGHRGHPVIPLSQPACSFRLFFTSGNSTGYAECQP